MHRPSFLTSIGAESLLWEVVGVGNHGLVVWKYRKSSIFGAENLQIHSYWVLCTRMHSQYVWLRLGSHFTDSSCRMKSWGYIEPRSGNCIIRNPKIWQTCIRKTCSSSKVLRFFQSTWPISISWLMVHRNMSYFATSLSDEVTPLIILVEILE